MSYTYGSIKTKVRNITGRLSTDQMSNTELGSYIDNFYTVSLPNTIKSEEMLQTYSFQTVEGTDEYAFPSTSFYTVTPTARADGFQLFWYQDPNLFYSDYPEQYGEEEISDGDDVTVTYAGSLDTEPVLVGSLIIWDGVEIFLDNGDGTLTGDGGGTGTIVYSTGAYSVTFNAAPLSTNTIKAKYEPYTAGQPRSIMLYNNHFVIRPVPDTLYNISMQGYIKPSAMTDDSDTPFSDTLAPLIIYGTSLEIFAENGDMEHYGQYYPVYQKYYDMALDKTTQGLLNVRSVPTW